MLSQVPRTSTVTRRTLTSSSGINGHHQAVDHATSGASTSAATKYLLHPDMNFICGCIGAAAMKLFNRELNKPKLEGQATPTRIHTDGCIGALASILLPTSAATMFPEELNALPLREQLIPARV